VVLGESLSCNRCWKYLQLGMAEMGSEGEESTENTPPPPYIAIKSLLLEAGGRERENMCTQMLLLAQEVGTCSFLAGD